MGVSSWKGEGGGGSWLLDHGCVCATLGDGIVCTTDVGRSSALAYCAPALPTSMARWFLLIHGDVKPFGSFEAQFTVKAIFALGGVCDVLVFLLTPHRYLLFGAPPAADPRLNGA